MHHTLFLILGLLFVVFLLVMVAQRIRVAYPIFLVVAGLGISFIPGVPHFHLDPEIIFILFLPPLLYEAAWYTSWHSFWKWKRPIALLAFGLVFLTATIVAYTSTFLIPGFTLALGFLLGGIVSPPDAVAASTVLKGMSIPKRIMTILEGESLVNDASSLIVFRFALVAVLTSTFSFQVAIGQFFLVAGMGIVVGLIGANIMYLVHRFLPTTPPIDAALTVMTPYILFLSAEYFHFSGVMAVVSGGLFMTYRAHEVFQTGSTRMNMLGVWTTIIFAMNALVFILIGLELPEIIVGLGEYSVADGIKYGLIISAVTIAVRFAWVYPIAHLPRWLNKKERLEQPSPGWKGPLVISWAGMRGVVSLATALSIPLLMTDGTAFPQRNLIIFITFVVIFVTLVLQGLTLPFVIRLIKLEEIDPMISEEEQQAQIQIRLSKVAIELIDGKYAEHAKENELLRIYKSHLQNEITDKQMELECLECSTRKKGVPLYHQAAKEVFGLQRKELFKLRKEKVYSDEEIRNAEMQIDLDELKITGTGH